MATLTWAVKGSLLSYLTGTARGRIELWDGAEMTHGGIRFPSAEEPDHPLAFRGGVLMTGHGGLLRIVLHAPVVHREEDGSWLLSACSEHGDRIAMAQIAQFAEDETGFVQAGTTTLTEPGTAIFGGQYPVGTVLDSPTIRW